MVRGAARAPLPLLVSLSLLVFWAVATVDRLRGARQGTGCCSRCCSFCSISCKRCLSASFSASIAFDSCSSSVMIAALSSSNAVGVLALYRSSTAVAAELALSLFPGASFEVERIVVAGAFITSL